MLERSGLVRDIALPEPEHRFLTTGQPDQFRTVGRRFLGPELDHVHQFARIGVGA